ncbi:hypothetical protein C8Q79DRAFT_106566 [Trametes meyenii]|nr:hypothetical protein C8Q79DRAFT_106566 [Trametes meyenii]
MSRLARTVETCKDCRHPARRARWLAVSSATPDVRGKVCECCNHAGIASPGDGQISKMPAQDVTAEVATGPWPEPLTDDISEAVDECHDANGARCGSRSVYALIEIWRPCTINGWGPVIRKHRKPDGRHSPPSTPTTHGPDPRHARKGSRAGRRECFAVRIFAAGPTAYDRVEARTLRLVGTIIIHVSIQRIRAVVRVEG